MSTSATVHIGVDVAKDSIVVCGPEAATVMTVRNTPAVLRAWLAGLPAGAQLICEATGRYHYALQAACAAGPVPLTCHTRQGPWVEPMNCQRSAPLSQPT